MRKGARSVLLAAVCPRPKEENASRAVRLLLARVWAQRFPTPMPSIAKTESGKPYFQERGDLFLSLSHTDTHVLCAIGDVPLGADVQTRRPLRPGMERYVCGDGELEDFDFFQLWCMKESWIKLHGGPDRPLREVCFRRGQEGILTPDPEIHALLWDTVPGCAAAICWRGEARPELLFLTEEEVHPREEYAPLKQGDHS